MKLWVCLTVKISPNPSSVNIRLCKKRIKVFYCFYKLTFPSLAGVINSTSTSSRVCITVSNSPNPSSVYIRLCKHRKKVFQLLKYCFFRKILLLCRLLDCKTVGFFLKISKEIGKVWRKSLAREQRASLTRPTGVWGESKKPYFLASLPSLALCFQPRSRPFVWLLVRTWLNTQKSAKIRTVLQSSRL